MTSPEQRRHRATSFGAAASAYERGRPSYPMDAVRWLLPSGAATVLDLGAGTGKLTRVLLDLDLDVVGVEPTAGMREQFALALPGVPILAGSAEEIPLASGSVDAVLVAQAWHWVDPVRAAPEVARVLRPGGLLGLLWNVRDERVPWVARLGELLADPDQGDSRTAESADPTVGVPFGQGEVRTFGWSQPLDAEGLVDLVASRSYVIVRDPAEREDVLNRVRRFAATDPDMAGRSTFELPYLTECFKFRPE